MAITPVQKRGIEEVIQALCSATKGRRKICEMFMELPDREAWPEYYKVIPEPRCLEGISSAVEKNKYKDAIAVFDDIQLVFANALHFNDQASQIARDAVTLRDSLNESWKKHPALPDPPPPSPPPTEPPAQIRPIAIKPPAQPSSTPPVRLAPSSRVPQPTAQAPAQPVAVGPATQYSIEEDGDMSPEPPEIDLESQNGEIAAREDESAEIVRQLERGLPRWDGGHDKGWLDEVPGDPTAKFREIFTLLKDYKHSSGQRIWSALEEIPEDSQIKNLSYTGPLSVKIIETRIDQGGYPSPRHFDQDMARLFERARRWYTPGSEAYGHSILLQRIYNLLSSPPFPSTIPFSTTNFASLSAGPGVARPLHSQSSDGPVVTTFRISTKDRNFTDEIVYKGMTYKMGDWVHLANPDDPSKPIIAQVFKTWTHEGDRSPKPQQYLAVCWYFRPEQTVHPVHRPFWDHEVFKTGHFADHTVEDIIEKIACQFTAKHIRGRPRPPYWYPGWPLYVCDSRYNDKEKSFVKIKNWNSCIPEEYRKNDFMPIYPFERIVYPKRYPSPFLSGITGPGRIGDNIQKPPEPEKLPEDVSGGRRRSKRHLAQSTDHVGPRHGTFVGTPVPAPHMNQQMAPGGSALPATIPAQIPGGMGQNQDKSIGAAIGGLANFHGNAVVETLPAETTKHFDRDPETNQVLWFSGPPIDVARTPMPKHSLKYLHYLAMKKRERELSRVIRNSDAGTDRMDIDGEAPPPAKRRQVEVRPRMTDALGNLLTAMNGNGESR